MHNIIVPVLDGEPLLNAIGSNETEARAGVGLLDLTDEELDRVEFHSGYMVWDLAK